MASLWIDLRDIKFQLFEVFKMGETLLGKGRFTFIGLPMKWREGTGSPIRAVAVFDI